MLRLNKRQGAFHLHPRQAILPAAAALTVEAEAHHTAAVVVDSAVEAAVVEVEARHTAAEAVAVEAATNKLQPRFV